MGYEFINEKLSRNAVVFITCKFIMILIRKKYNLFLKHGAQQWVHRNSLFSFFLTLDSILLFKHSTKLI